jgi:ribosomal protein S18 acetylase RimI-like enzyme
MRELVEAAYRMYVPRIGREPVPMTADYDEIARSGRAWIAEVHARVVGVLVLETAEDHLLVENLAVAPPYQNVGVGSRLLRFAEDQARARGLPEVRLYTHVTMTENQAYYPRRGFRETHRAGEDGFRRVFFAKRLDEEA